MVYCQIFSALRENFDLAFEMSFFFFFPLSVSDTVIFNYI